MTTTKLTLGVKDLMEILDRSRPTIYRWHDDGTLPPTIDIGGKKRRLLWSRDSIVAFLENRGSRAPPSTPPVESATSLAKRHADAMAELQGLGVNVGTPSK